MPTVNELNKIREREMLQAQKENQYKPEPPLPILHCNNCGRIIEAKRSYIGSRMRGFHCSSCGSLDLSTFSPNSFPADTKTVSQPTQPTQPVQPIINVNIEQPKIQKPQDPYARKTEIIEIKEITYQPYAGTARTIEPKLPEIKPISIMRLTGYIVISMIGVFLWVTYMMATSTELIVVFPAIVAVVMLFPVGLAYMYIMKKEAKRRAGEKKHVVV